MTKLSAYSNNAKVYINMLKKETLSKWHIYLLLQLKLNKLNKDISNHKVNIMPDYK